jgi:hypothetical protein
VAFCGTVLTMMDSGRTIMSAILDDAILPTQTPATLQEKSEQVQQQRALVAQWRATGDPQLIQDADALQAQYHVRDMAELSGDVYASAAHEPASPGLGWIRLSEHPELLKERLSVDWSKQQIHEYLQPDNSDFRAEIYLPDPRVYGSDVRPVIATKGSNGPIAVPDGKGGMLLRQSALEDWIENARQGIGLESDHADRAMTLATDFQHDFHGAFENVGHSKGAVGASAGAELTGMPAYIFNGAGLHPNTVQRYAQQHHLQVLGTDKIIHSYHVQGEVLHDVQAGIHNMDPLTRAQVGLAAQQLGELGQMQDVHALVREQLAKALPYDPKMQQDASGLIDYLGSHRGAELLKGVPLAAGASQIELPAKMRDAQGQLVDRAQQPTLDNIGADAGPLMNVVSCALAGGVVGKQYGDVLATGGRGFERGAQWVGATAQKGMEVYGYVLNANIQGHGRLVAGAMHYGGAAAADMREMHGQIQSTVDRGIGRLAQLSASMDGAVLRVGSHIPGLIGLKQIADREARAADVFTENQRTQATQDLHNAQRDAGSIRHFADTGADSVVHSSRLTGEALQHLAQLEGGLVNGGYRAAGTSVRGVTDQAPEAGAMLGMVTGSTAVTAGELATNGIPAALQTDRVLRHGKGAALEAVTRHGVQYSVLPSLDASIREMEAKGMDRMQELQRSSPQLAQQLASPEKNPAAFLQRMLESANSGNWEAFRNDTQTLAAMQPGKQMHADAVACVDLKQQLVAQWQTVQQTGDLQHSMQQTAGHGISL